MTALEQCDSVLTFFATSTYTQGRTTDGVALNHYNEKAGEEKIAAGHFVEIVQKLQKDGFLGAVVSQRKQYTEFGSLSINEYYVTFEGRMFIENGGYAQAKEDKESERRHLKKMEQFTFNVTVLIAIGSVGLVLWEMVKFFFLENHH